MAVDPAQETPSLAEQAYRRLEEMIVTLEFPPGALLSEASLAVRLGLGRTPVREALLRLADDHLVEVMPRRGIRVTDVNVERQLLLLETRRELERLVATRATRRATKVQRQRLEKLAAVAARRSVGRRSLEDEGLVATAPGTKLFGVRGVTVAVVGQTNAATCSGWYQLA